MGWDGMGDGMGWDGMGWDGMGWDGMGPIPSHLKMSKSQKTHTPPETRLIFQLLDIGL